MIPWEEELGQGRSRGFKPAVTPGSFSKMRRPNELEGELQFGGGKIQKVEKGGGWALRPFLAGASYSFPV